MATKKILTSNHRFVNVQLKRKQPKTKAGPQYPGASRVRFCCAGHSLRWPPVRSARSSQRMARLWPRGGALMATPIAQYSGLVGSTIAALEEYLTALTQADGDRLLDLECETARVMEALIREMDTGEVNQAFYEAATGKSKSFWCLKAMIEGGEERNLVQREIDAFADDPAFVELQVLLDGR